MSPIFYDICLIMLSWPFHVQIVQILHLVEQLCLALQDEFRTYLPSILPNCIQVLVDAERCNDFGYVPDILHTFDVFGGLYISFFSCLSKLCVADLTYICHVIFFFIGTLDEHMHLVFPVLIRLFKVDASVDIRRHAIQTITKLIPRVHVS